MTNTIRRFILGDDVLDALLLQGRATATVEFETHTEHVEFIIDETTDGMNAIYQDR